MYIDNKKIFYNKLFYSQNFSINLKNKNIIYFFLFYLICYNPNNKIYNI